MKPAGKHPDRALSALKAKAASKPGRYADGNGLYLIVDPSGAKRWVLRTVVQGRRRDIGLGGIQLVSLAEAREKALQYRKTARDGGDPLAERRRARLVVPSFAEAARSVHRERAPSWRNAKHAAQWITTLEEYAFPLIGANRVDQIDTPELLKVLAPIWLTKPETARRLKQRMGTVLDWAKAAGLRTGENPAEVVMQGLPRQPDRKRHHAALPYEKVPEFIDELRHSSVGDIVKLAFEFLILTAGRTNEVIGARWSEIDAERRVWTVPAVRVKGNREHRVPLCDRSLELLREAKEIGSGGEFVFPGRTLSQPISNMAFLMALRRKNAQFTAHGFRSAFRDWAAERTNFPREVCEAALAHVLKDKVEAAYRRSDLFEKRRELMATWSAFLNPASAQVISLRSA